MHVLAGMQVGFQDPLSEMWPVGCCVLQLLRTHVCSRERARPETKELSLRKCEGHR